MGFPLLSLTQLNDQDMDLDKIKDALESSLSLLNEEFESVTLEELKEEYLSVIQKIENALITLEKNG